MVNYTPGFHILASLGGAVAGRDGLHAVHVLLAASVAIKVGLVVLHRAAHARQRERRRRVAGSDAAGTALALAAALLVFLPDDYFIGSFVRLKARTSR